MSYLLIHADRAATLLADDPIVPAAEIGRFRDTVALLAAAADARDDETTRLAGAETDARARGHADGLAAGHAAAAGEVRAELFALAVKAAKARRRQRDDVAALAIEVVRRIAGELGQGEMVAALAERAAAALTDETAATVRVHPQALAMTTARLAERESVRVEADAELDPTDCVVETALGRTHAGLETQLAAIERAWVQAAPEAGDGR